MTVKQLAEKCSFKVLSMPDGDREIDGCYMGDLLSWVMGRANADNVWITIMTNSNITAVASLADMSCILLAEDALPDKDVINIGMEKNINIISSPLPQYETAISVYTALQE